MCVCMAAVALATGKHNILTCGHYKCHSTQVVATCVSVWQLLPWQHFLRHVGLRAHQPRTMFYNTLIMQWLTHTKYCLLSQALRGVSWRRPFCSPSSEPGRTKFRTMSIPLTADEKFATLFLCFLLICYPCISLHF